MREIHIHTDMDPDAICPCGTKAYAPWDPDDGPTIPLCEPCYREKAIEAIETMYRQLLRSDPLQIQHGVNFRHASCHDCGVNVPHRAGFPAWSPIYKLMVVLCNGCASERNQALHDERKYL